MTVKMGGKYKTRDDRYEVIEVLCVDAPGPYPVFVRLYSLPFGVECTTPHLADGRFLDGIGESHWDLIEVETEEEEPRHQEASMFSRLRKYLFAPPVRDYHRELVEAFGLEVEAMLRSLTSSVTKPGSSPQSPYNRFELCDRLRRILYSLEDRLYEDTPRPELIRTLSATLAALSLLAANEYGELLPRRS